jgi:hypothetical protein
MSYLPLFNYNSLVSTYKYFTEKLIMNAQEYRALVNKLALLEDDADDGHLAAAAQPGVTAVPSTIEDQIMHAPTFNQAYAMARKAGLKKFKWCQCKEYMVKDAPPVKPTPNPTPVPKPVVPATTDFVTTNPMGDFDPTPFNGQAAARR